MKVLVVGGGGREHAIIKKIKENKTVEQIFALPGNGGIATDATCVDIGAKDIEKIVDGKKVTKSLDEENYYTITVSINNEEKTYSVVLL